MFYDIWSCMKNFLIDVLWVDENMTIKELKDKYCKKYTYFSHFLLNIF